MNKLFPTRVALHETVRRELITMLNTVLASSIDLYTQIKQAHWNIKGAHFFARHQLFDDIAAHALAWSDEVAERTATLGGYAAGTVRDAAERSKLRAYDPDAVEGIDHMRALVERFESFTKMTREAISTSSKLDDPVTEDLCTEILRQAELDLWFLESHING